MVGPSIDLSQVPPESYRLGKTRVFFRAGQISTLQKILNETGPDKAPWILSRLKEALANRQQAKAAAESARVSRPDTHHTGICIYVCLFVSHVLTVPEICLENFTI